MTVPVLGKGEQVDAGWWLQIARFFTTRNLILMMTGLQMTWLVMIWVTGSTTAVTKIAVLLIYTLVGGAIALWLPVGNSAFIIRLRTVVARHQKRTLLLLLVLVAAVGVYYAYAQRVWTFDEEGVVEAATVVATDGLTGLFDNYGKRPWLGRQHPPLIPIIHGAAMMVFGTQPIIARLVTLAFALGTGVVIFAIGQQLFEAPVGLLAAALFFSFPLVFRLGTVAMVEIPLTFFFAATLYVTIRYLQTSNLFFLVGMALLLVAGLLVKYTMVFVLPVIFGFFVVYGRWRQAAWSLLVLGVAGGAVLAGWLLLADNLGALTGQFDTLRSYALMLATNPYGRQLLFETYTTRLPSSLGLYTIPVAALGTLLLIWRRQKADWLLLLWTALVWIPVTFTLPDHRYFLSSFPAIAILMAVTLLKIPATLSRIIFLTTLFTAGALYLFIDWARAAELFVN